MKNEGATCFGTIQKVHHLSARGFCFIAPDDGDADVFAHVRDFASPIGGIERGDPVSYVVLRTTAAASLVRATSCDCPRSNLRDCDGLFCRTGLWIYRA